MLFGNDDDGIFGEEPTAKYHISKPNTVGKAAGWAFRNPLHNFCFYVIGTANCVNSEFTILQMTPGHFCALCYRKEACTVFPGSGTGFFLGFAWLEAIYFSAVGIWIGAKSEFYLGWRCRGNFGVKCIPYTKH